MQELIEFLQQILSIDSSTRQGAVRCLHRVLDAARDMGFTVGNMNDLVGWAEYGNGDELVAVLGHLDVVPAGAGWTKNPFGGEIENGRIYGRGATDDKGPILAALFALKALRDAGTPLRRRVRILFGTEEETGCTDMRYYVENGGELPVLGFTPDGEFPLIHGEKGLVLEEYACAIPDGPLRTLQGGTAANMVPAHARAELADGTVLECDGVSAHGAEPWNGVNAIGKLLGELDRLPLHGQAQTAIAFLSRRIGMETDGASLGIAAADDCSGKLSFNLGQIDLHGGTLRVTVNYRCPVTHDLDACTAKVRSAFRAAGFSLVRADVEPPLYIPEDAPLVRTLMKIYNTYTGGKARPICIGGGTYAKSMPNTVAFGPIFPGDEVTEHRPDEYISLQRLRQNCELITMAIEALANM